MAISPPSDIVLDVARAVSPDAVETARVALEKRAQTGTVAAPFEPVGPDTTYSAANAAAREASGKSPTAKAYQKFESVVLQTFLQSMMPKDTESVYGSGLAGDMWKSELAQQVASVMAKRGGIGIANRLLKAHYEKDGKMVALTGASDGPAKAQRDAQHLISHALVNDMQRKLTSPLITDTSVTSDETKI